MPVPTTGGGHPIVRYIVVPIRTLSRPAAPSPSVTALERGVAHAAHGEGPARNGHIGGPDGASVREGARTAPVPVAAVTDDDAALAHWVAAARTSIDACLVVTAGGTVAALSPTAAEMLGTNAMSLVGQSLDAVLHLVDFTDGANEARGIERRIPPLIALRENSLSRGMMRVRRPDGHRLMLDAVAAPIHDTERRPIGAVSFLAAV
jgi:PAS domain S-box-containing protein